MSKTGTTRLLKSLQLIQKNPIPRVITIPLPQNIFQWHFVIYGEDGTSYEGGEYHGTIIFPKDYPFQPPDIYMFTPTGRFNTETKICMSMTSFHKDTWNPLWSVDSLILGFQSFMYEESNGVGSIRATNAERKKLAEQSREWNRKRQGENSHKDRDYVTALRCYSRCLSILSAEQSKLPESDSISALISTQISTISPRILAFVKDFSSVLSTHRHHTSSLFDPFQISSLTGGYVYDLGNLTPVELSRTIFRPPNPQQLFALCELYFLCGVRALELKEKAEAFTFFTEALYLLKDLKNENYPPEIQTKIKSRMKSALDQAEKLKAQVKSTAHILNSSLTLEEKQIILDSSIIMNTSFPIFTSSLPHNTSPEACNSHRFPTFRLSQHQLSFNSTFISFPTLLSSTNKNHYPTVFGTFNPGTITQTVVGDCSFLSSLAVLALAEKKTGQRLLTKLIYPQDQNGNAFYPQNGIFTVRLFVNGVWRSTMVNDSFPATTMQIGGNHLFGIPSSSTQQPQYSLLCSHSTIPSEMWVSILEKAYLQVFGANYDFNGSQSGVDIHILSGWIPDRWSLKEENKIKLQQKLDSKPAEERIKFLAEKKEKKWRKIQSGMELNMAVVTISTRCLSTQEMDDTGLLTNHAYAVMSTVEVGPNKMVQMRNPWGFSRWKGRFGVISAAWTPELLQKCHYSTDLAQRQDDGIFWIEFEDILKYFDNVNISWSPSLFNFKTAIHLRITPEQLKLPYQLHLAHFPQVLVQKKQNQTIWLLLTRHITDLDIKPTTSSTKKPSTAIRLCFHSTIRATSEKGQGNSEILVEPYVQRLIVFPSLEEKICHYEDYHILEKIPSTFEGFLSVGSDWDEEDWRGGEGSGSRWCLNPLFSAATHSELYQQKQNEMARSSSQGRAQTEQTLSHRESEHILTIPQQWLEEKRTSLMNMSPATPASRTALPFGSPPTPSHMPPIPSMGSPYPNLPPPLPPSTNSSPFIPSSTPYKQFHSSQSSSLFPPPLFLYLSSSIFSPQFILTLTRKNTDIRTHYLAENGQIRKDRAQKEKEEKESGFAIAEDLSRRLLIWVETTSQIPFHFTTLHLKQPPKKGEEEKTRYLQPLEGNLPLKQFISSFVTDCTPMTAKEEDDTHFLVVVSPQLSKLDYSSFKSSPLDQSPQPTPSPSSPTLSITDPNSLMIHAVPPEGFSISLTQLPSPTASLPFCACCTGFVIPTILSTTPNPASDTPADIVTTNVLFDLKDSSNKEPCVVHVMFLAINTTCAFFSSSVSITSIDDLALFGHSEYHSLISGTTFNTIVLAELRAKENRERQLPETERGNCGRVLSKPELVKARKVTFPSTLFPFLESPLRCGQILPKTPFRDSQNSTGGTDAGYVLSCVTIESTCRITGGEKALIRVQTTTKQPCSYVMFVWSEREGVASSLD
ncbi:putative Ubiquitin-conjugating enzyme E2 J2 [Blattamonas nauphoetae]|uniref:Ubiquitin-conjugating enzyme E2 J2 n=1 Tax=Blattamonas nauphoetae TaxID=2049346 RepID=A0ABQ9YAX7_9EUKA|nr:putative Ubiquitin-conjugating enzyme E2 J2 [Blattamonas nauphoetae]